MKNIKKRLVIRILDFFVRSIKSYNKLLGIKYHGLRHVMHMRFFDLLCRNPSLCQQNYWFQSLRFHLVSHISKVCCCFSFDDPQLTATNRPIRLDTTPHASPSPHVAPQQFLKKITRHNQGPWPPLPLPMVGSPILHGLQNDPAGHHIVGVNHGQVGHQHANNSARIFDESHGRRRRRRFHLIPQVALQNL